MIRILGMKVVIMLIVLASLAAAGGYGVYAYLMPMREKRESEVQTLKAETSSRYQEVTKLKEEFVLLQSQLRHFKELEAQGYFSNQNRVEAQNSFNNLRQLSGLLKTKYDISAGQRIDDPVALEANHVILKSPVKLEIDSLDDVDVYTFVKALEEKFPGSVDITSFTLTRDENITAALLRKIGSGQPVKLVSAKLEFDWRTMANKDRLDEFDTSTSTGEQNDDAQQAGVTPPVITPGAVAPQTQLVPQAVQ